MFFEKNYVKKDIRDAIGNLRDACARIQMLGNDPKGINRLEQSSYYEMRHKPSCRDILILLGKNIPEQGSASRKEWESQMETLVKQNLIKVMKTKRDELWKSMTDSGMTESADHMSIIESLDGFIELFAEIQRPEKGGIS